MSDVQVKLSWNGGLKFTGVTAGGVVTALDGDRQAGASPVEILLEALGACTAIDVVLILDKQKTPAVQFEVTLAGDRHSPEPRYYTAVQMRFDVWGEGITPAKLERAIQLSIGKYCSVYHSLRSDLRLTSAYRIHAPNAAAAGEYAAVELALA
jgi:putative redox protein